MVYFILAKFFAIENESVWYLIEDICMIHPFLPKVALRFLSALRVIISHSPFLKSRYWKQDYQGACGHLKNSLKEFSNYELSGKMGSMYLNFPGDI